MRLLSHTLLYSLSLLIPTFSFTSINDFMNEKDPKFCYVPFTGFSVSPRGIIRSCCAMYNNNMVNWENVRDVTPAIQWPTPNIKELICQNLLVSSLKVYYTANWFFHL